MKTLHSLGDRVIVPSSFSRSVHFLVIALVACSLNLIAPPTRAATDFKFRGLLDLGLISSVEGRELNRLTFGDSPVDPYRLRLFLDAQLSPSLELHVQTILHEGAGAIRADGAYALWTPWAGRDISIEAGKIPWPIGTYAPRTYSDKNALMGTPLMYQYRTGLPWHHIVTDVDDQVGRAGQAQFTPDEPYLPLIDERWWDTGAALVGSWAPFEWSAGIVQGSPSWPAPGVDNTPGHTVLGRFGFVPVTGVRVGVSGADGTWMPAFWEFLAAPGTNLREYRETTLMADAEFSRGPFELRGEAVRRRWETLKTGNLDATSGYAEARYAMPNGAWLALRGETLRFSDVTPSTLVARPWDDTVDRFEAIVGYRVTQEVRLKAGMQRTRRHPWNAARIDTDLLMAGMSIRF